MDTGDCCDVSGDRNVHSVAFKKAMRVPLSMIVPSNVIFFFSKVPPLADRSSPFWAGFAMTKDDLSR